MDKNAKSKNYITAIAALSVICTTIIIVSAQLPRITNSAPLNYTQTRQSNAYISAIPRHYPRNYECAKLSETKEMQIILKRNPLKHFVYLKEATDENI